MLPVLTHLLALLTKAWASNLITRASDLITQPSFAHSSPVLLVLLTVLTLVAFAVAVLSAFTFVSSQLSRGSLLTTSFRSVRSNGILSESAYLTILKYKITSFSLTPCLWVVPS